MHIREKGKEGCSIWKSSTHFMKNDIKGTLFCEQFIAIYCHKPYPLGTVPCMSAHTENTCEWEYSWVQTDLHFRFCSENFFQIFGKTVVLQVHIWKQQNTRDQGQCTSGFGVKNPAVPGVWLELGLDEAFDLLGGQSISDSKGTWRRRGHRHDRRCNLCSHIPAILDFFALSLSFLCCCSSLPVFLLLFLLLLLLLVLLSLPTLLPPSAYYSYFLPFSSSRGCNSCKWQRRRSIPAAAAGGLYQSDAP